MPDRRGEHTAGAAHRSQLNLALAGQAMADLLPVKQVRALEDGHSREILKGAADHIIDAVHFAYAGVRVEAFDYRIVVFHTYTSSINSYIYKFNMITSKEIKHQLEIHSNRLSLSAGFKSVKLIEI
jgi:hypothetical protein